jgi:hypothetical protein
MLERLIDALRRRGSPGVHLGSALNTRIWFLQARFRERSASVGSDACIYMGIRLSD